MRRIYIFAFLLILCTSMSCSMASLFQSPTPTPSATNTSHPTKTSTPTLTKTPVPPAETPSATPTEDMLVEINLVNDTGDLICAVFAYTAEESGELPNLLENEVLMMGQSKTVEVIMGEYTFEVWDCQANQLHNLYGFIIEEDFDWNLSEEPENYVYEGQQSLILINERAWDICELYIREADSEDWGDNLFRIEANYYLAAGSTLIEPIESGVFDFKLVYCDGTIASTLEDLEVPEGQSMEWKLTP